jgi:hypothetical protein
MSIKSTQGLPRDATNATQSTRSNQVTDFFEMSMDQIKSPLIATSEQQKSNKLREPEKEYAEIWDESGSLIGIISPNN